MCIMYANASNNTPSYPQISLYVIYRVHPQKVLDKEASFFELHFKTWGMLYQCYVLI